ncbi:hypothetical protein KY337_04475 [Candidatus Woesearchaeota archaeon]|nr:hypothetical protein [Candidatus Woesearchaeota archaeon]
MVKFKVINNELRINKTITKLDKFAFDVIEIIEKYTKYVIISGYVSIFFGRSRATEDIDMFIEKISYDRFIEMYNEFVSKGFEFTVDNHEDLYNEYLMKGTAINIWRKDFPLMRMEIKVAKKTGQKLVLLNPIKVYVNDNKILFSQIEAQIAYKRYISASEKDIEDARHLEIVFDDIDIEKIKYFKDLFNKDENKNGLC